MPLSSCRFAAFSGFIQVCSCHCPSLLSLHPSSSVPAAPRAISPLLLCCALLQSHHTAHGMQQDGCAAVGIPCPLPSPPFPAGCSGSSRAPQAARLPWDHSSTVLRKDCGNPNQPFCRAVPLGKLPGRGRQAERQHILFHTTLFQKAVPRVPNKYDILSSYFANILFFFPQPS